MPALLPRFLLCLYGTGKGVDVYTRKQALLFLHVCLASVLNLRSPDDSQLPGSQLDKLVEMLFGDQEDPHIEPISNEGGVKTKTQLLAERQVLKQLLSTAVGAAADTDLAADATPFAHGVCRHFAMLFAAGCSSPSMGGWQVGVSQSPEGTGPANGPPTAGSFGGAAAAGNSGGKARDGSGRGRIPKGHALKELDAHLFFDALVEVPLCPYCICPMTAGRSLHCSGTLTLPSKPCCTMQCTNTEVTATSGMVTACFVTVVLSCVTGMPCRHIVKHMASNSQHEAHNHL